MVKKYEIRDPVHGFIEFDEWERDIINHSVFQRLRRIRQLAWTDMVYPGAMHTRFEHSLGVMHTATRLFDEISNRRKTFLENELKFDTSGLAKDRIIVRLAALLHDLGHAPFSHALEELMPINPSSSKRYTHEDYSAAAAYKMTDVIEKHPQNQNYGITVSDIDSLYSGKVSTGRRNLWRNLLSSQLDADRADYLLRDSHHIGVEYGRYDLNRLAKTITVGMDEQSGDPTLAIEKGGLHTAESLIIARYMMFTQVYLQHTRRSYDHHIVGAIRSVLETETGKAVFPSPDRIDEYLDWTDWKVLGCISRGLGGKDGEVLLNRRHDRSVFETKEVPRPEDLDEAESLFNQLGQEIGEEHVFIDRAVGSWYKPGSDIMILEETNAGQERLVPLSSLSNVVKELGQANQVRIYVSMDFKDKAKGILRKIKNF
jgi:HD superfamily phosphohydrolase